MYQNRINVQDGGFIYRNALPGDMEDVFSLIKELAVFEKATHKVTNTVEQLIKDGCGSEPLFGVILAKEINSGKAVGMSFYYFRYSTWTGKCLYVEDLIITERYRDYGIGRKLLALTAQIAINNQCNTMRWQVLDWNKPAIDFYKMLGGEISSEWLNVDLNSDTIHNLVKFSNLETNN